MLNLPAKVWYYLAGLFAGCGAGVIGTNLAIHGHAVLIGGGGLLMVFGWCLGVAQAYHEDRYQRSSMMPERNSSQG